MSGSRRLSARWRGWAPRRPTATRTRSAAVCNGPAQASNSTTAAQALGGARTAEATCSEASLTTPCTATAAPTPQRCHRCTPTARFNREPAAHHDKPHCRTRRFAGRRRTDSALRPCPPPPRRQRASPTRGPTFDMSGMTRLAGACPLDGGVRRLLRQQWVSHACTRRTR